MCTKAKKKKNWKINNAQIKSFQNPVGQAASKSEMGFFWYFLVGTTYTHLRTRYYYI